MEIKTVEDAATYALVLLEKYTNDIWWTVTEKEERRFDCSIRFKAWYKRTGSLSIYITEQGFSYNTLFPKWGTLENNIKAEVYFMIHEVIREFMETFDNYSIALVKDIFPVYSNQYCYGTCNEQKQNTQAADD